MSNVIIRFKPDRTALVNSIQQIDKEFESFIKMKKEDVDTQIDLVSQDVSNLIRDTTVARKVTATENAKLLSLKLEQEHVKTLQDKLHSNVEANQREYNKLNAQIKVLQEKIDNMKATATLVKAESEAAISNWQKVSASVSATLGFLSLITAITGQQEDQTLSFILAMMSSTVSVATAYASLGAASGNWAMLAAAGAMAASTASIINTLKAIGTRRAQQEQMNKRRLQQRKV